MINKEISSQKLPDFLGTICLHINKTVYAMARPIYYDLH